MNLFGQNTLRPHTLYCFADSLPPLINILFGPAGLGIVDGIVPFGGSGQGTIARKYRDFARGGANIKAHQEFRVFLNMSFSHYPSVGIGALPHLLAAGDVDGLPGHVTCFIGGQEDEDIRHVFVSATSLKRHHIDVLLAYGVF